MSPPNYKYQSYKETKGSAEYNKEQTNLQQIPIKFEVNYSPALQLQSRRESQDDSCESCIDCKRHIIAMNVEWDEIVASD